MSEAEDQLLARLVHDLRNPLGVVAFFAESIPDAPEHERAEFCERLRINAERTLHILEEFALLADLRCGRTQPGDGRVDCAALLRDLTAELAAERGGAHIDRTGVAALELTGEPLHWQRALRTLLRDVARGAAGDVVIAGARAKSGRTLRIAVPLSVDRELGVSGRIDPDTLGIEMVRRLAHLHGGDLALSQRPGRAVITLTLPGL